jgi:hypothetical protein
MAQHEQGVFPKAEIPIPQQSSTENTTIPLGHEGIGLGVDQALDITAPIPVVGPATESQPSLNRREAIKAELAASLAPLAVGSVVVLVAASAIHLPGRGGSRGGNHAAPLGSAPPATPQNISKLRSKHSMKAEAKRNRDATFYQLSAISSLGRLGLRPEMELSAPPAVLSPVEQELASLREHARKHRAKSMTPRSNSYREVAKTKSEVYTARTSIQETASLRNNGRAEQVLRRNLRIEAKEAVYSNYSLTDKAKLKEELASQHLPFSRRRSIRKAGREVRRLEHANHRSIKRLKRAAAGNDIPGKYLNQ